MAVIALVGTRLTQKQSALLDVPINPLSPLTLSPALCLGLAAIASKIELTVIIGESWSGW